MVRRPFHLLFGATLACSLVVDTSEIDSGCGAGLKFCEGRCVRVNDPVYGCTLDQCRPCVDDGGDPFGDRIIPKCDGELCVVERCVFGFGCDECSRNLLADPANCGKCGEPCEVGLETCSNGACIPAWGAGGEAGN
jgi:hypothetical protein